MAASFRENLARKVDEESFDDALIETPVIQGANLGAELLTLTVLFAWVFGLNSLGLGALEFFRHTEADRTLIAWEMLESRDFVVPHLMQSTILTKPPLYYWLSAASISFWGEVTEWVARFPSFVISLLFTFVQYAIFRLNAVSRVRSFYFALVLSSSLSFFVLSTVAEIDLAYGFFSALALYGAFFAVYRDSARWTMAAYFALALAFLTKGPPIVFFFAASHVLYFLYRKPAVSELMQFFWRNLLGLGLCLATISLWVLPLAAEVGWSALGEQVYVEVFERAISPSRQKRGAFFYLGSLIAGLVPWSPLFLLGLLQLLRQKLRGAALSLPRSGVQREIFAFSLIVMSSSLLMLSISSGKSSRYFFPAHVFAVNVAAYVILSLQNSEIEKRLFHYGTMFFPIATLIALSLPLFLSFDGVPFSAVLLSSFFLAVPIFMMTISCRLKNRYTAIACLALTMLPVRYGQGVIYAAHRNSTSSVRELATEIDRAVPRGETIYTVEMFERWISFYLKQQGRLSARITPDMLTPDQGSIFGKTVFLLLSANEERWRVKQLQAVDPTLELREFKGGRGHVFLVKAQSDKLSILNPSAVFPTRSTKPS